VNNKEYREKLKNDSKGIRYFKIKQGKGVKRGIIKLKVIQ